MVQTTFPLRSKNVCTTSGGMFLYAKTLHFYLDTPHFYLDTSVNKAIKNVKRQQGDVSEVHDELSTGIATEVHHIFPKSQFPTIATYYENLILLTSS